MKPWKSSKIRWRAHQSWYTHRSYQTHTPVHAYTHAQIMPSIFLFQSQNKPSTFHKEEAGLKVSMTAKSSPIGPPGSNPSLAPPSGAFCKSAMSVEGQKKRIKMVCVNVRFQCPESCRLRRRPFRLSSTAGPVRNITLIQMFPGNSTWGKRCISQALSGLMLI